jgi:DNA invertase Pin-like site-specific DNA recombinase
MQAAQYARMSTEHQQYSIQNQEAAIALYAQEHGFDIVRSYRDEAKSGLDLAHRPGLRALLEDVVNPQRGFVAILVLDVSRWGRFQDIDESAYYEYTCKRQGVRVHCCAEPFANDESLTTVLLKTLKRAMAGEYIRELSTKVFVGQCRIARNGYKLGGTPGYGLRRLLVDREGHAKCILHEGEWKSLSSDRVTYVPGPMEEVRVVQEIYSRFVSDNWSASKIAGELNMRGIRRDTGAEWDYFSVYDILRNAKYSGSIVFNRTSTKFKGKTRANPREEWIVQPNSFEALVPPEMFDQAQKRFSPNGRREKLLDDLRRLLQSRKRLTGKIIEGDPQIASPAAYHRNFGSLKNAYKLIGYERPTNVERVAKDQMRRSHFRMVKLRIMTALLREFVRRSIPVEPYSQGVVLVGYGRLEVQIARSLNPAFKGPRWDIVCAHPQSRQFMVIRMHVDNIRVRDYLLFHCLPAPRHSRLFIYESEISDFALSFKDIPALIAEIVPIDR